MDRNGAAVRMLLALRISRILRQSWRQFAVWLIPLSFLALFYFYPLGNILVTSLSRAGDGWAAPFQQALTSPAQLRVLWFTLWQALVSTILTLVVGLPGAYLLARYDFRGKALLLALTAIPFVMPTLVVAAAFYALLGPSGWINLALMEIFNLSQPPVQFVNTLHSHPGRARILQPDHRPSAGGRFLVTHRSQDGAGGKRAWRIARASPEENHLAALDARNRSCRAAGIHLRFHLLWGHPCAGRATVRHPGGRDLLPDHRIVQPAAGCCAVRHPAGLHAGDDGDLYPAIRAHYPARSACARGSSPSGS